MLQQRKAFTMLELIVVIVVAGILAGIAIPTFNSVKTRMNEQRAVQEAKAFAKEVSALAAFTEAGDAEDYTSDADADTAGSYAPGNDPTVGGVFTSSNGLDVNVTISGDIVTAANDVA